VLPRVTHNFTTPQLHTMTDENSGHLSDFEKGQMVTLASQGLSLSKIHTQVNRPKSTIKNFLHRYKIQGTEQNRPTLLNDHTQKLLVREATKVRRQPLCELHNHVAPGVSVNTVKRALREVNIKKWRALKRALLTEDHAHRRLAFSLVHRD
jgi:IS30 family transposase